MDKFWAYWALAFYILPVMLLVPYIRSRRRGVGHVLGSLALHRGGSVKSILCIPYYVGFNLNGIPVTLSLSQGRRHSPARTSLVAEVTAPVPDRLWISPLGPGMYSEKAANMPGSPVMSSEFESRFLVHADDENGARQFLTADIQTLLVKWHPQNLEVGVAKNKFSFSVRALLLEAKQLDEFIEDAGLLLERVVGLNNSGGIVGGT